MITLPARLSLITLGTRDLPRLRTFYQNLGWTEAPGSGDTWAAFVLGGAMLAMYPIDELALEAGTVPPAPGSWSGITLACNVDTPDQVDSAVDAAVRAGAALIAEPADRSWGGRSGYIADPDGNRWEVAWVPQSTFDDRGALISLGG